MFDWPTFEHGMKWIILPAVGLMLLGGLVTNVTAVRSEVYDPIVNYIESSYNVRPGDPLPQDWRTPNIHLQYKGTTPTGNGCYQVNICRYR
jgi:hypothetical protein